MLIGCVTTQSSSVCFALQNMVHQHFGAGSSGSTARHKNALRKFATFETFGYSLSVLAGGVSRCVRGRVHFEMAPRWAQH